MIIVWGCIEAAEDKIEDMKRMSIEHVHRSRKEPGCITHSVQVDLEKPNRLIFYEEWENMTALQKHFRVPESENFIKVISILAETPPSMKIFESEQVKQ